MNRVIVKMIIVTDANADNHNVVAQEILSLWTPEESKSNQCSTCTDKQTNKQTKKKQKHTHTHTHTTTTTTTTKTTTTTNKQLYCSTGISTIGKFSGCFPLGKPAATDSCYPTYGASWVF